MIVTTKRRVLSESGFYLNNISVCFMTFMGQTTSVGISEQIVDERERERKKEKKREKGEEREPRVEKNFCFFRLNRLKDYYKIRSLILFKCDLFPRVSRINLVGTGRCKHIE